MKCLLLLVLGIVICAVAGGIIKYQIFDDDTDDPTVLFAGFVILSMGILVSIGAMHMYGEKIESKTKIQPEVVVVTRNGVSDTTYVYRR
ncbi:MAG: hypothetical protein J6Y37_14130 [Paludibacteraceae bacterium]|nr:hypothetical protein [Paludibacteraceae bacterium]